MPEQRTDVAQTLINRAVASGALSEALVVRLQEFAAASPAIGQVRELLLGEGELNEYQLKQLMLGNSGRVRLGPYILIQPLGSGGMGEVVLARHSLMQREVALKTIRTQWVNDHSLVQRFLREIINAAKLSHENIVTAHDAGEHDGTLYLAMEYLSGSTLAEVVAEQGELPWSEAVEVTRQAARGLGYAHENHMIHRDVKPDNLMLVDSGVVKVMDLGLSRVRSNYAESIDGLTETGSVMGTVDYVAPEQARDAKSADARADIYSLGCTLYYLLTGEPPFPGGSLTEKILRHLTEPAPDLLRVTDAPNKLAELVRAMMAKSPDDRPPTMDAVIAALDEIESGDRSASPSTGSETERQSGTLIPPMVTDTQPVPVATATLTEPSTANALAADRTEPARPNDRRWIWWAIGLCGVLALAISAYTMSPPNQNDLVANDPPPTRSVQPANDSPEIVTPEVSTEKFIPTRNLPDLSAARAAHLVCVATTDQQPRGLPYLAAFGWENLIDDPFDPETAGVSVWELAETLPNTWLPTNGPVQSLSFAPNGQRLAAGTGRWESEADGDSSGGEIWIWKLNDTGFETPIHFRANANGVGSVGWWQDPQGRSWLVSGGWSNEHRSEEAGINLWNPLDGTRRASMETGGYGVRRLAVSNSLDLCLSATLGEFDPVVGAELRIWDLVNQQSVRSYSIAEPLVFQMEVSPTGDFALIAAGYGPIRPEVFADGDVPHGRLYRWRFDDEQPEVVAENVARDITSVSFATNGDRRVIWSSDIGEATWADYSADGTLSNQTPTAKPNIGYVFFAHAVTGDTVIYGGSGLTARHVYPGGQTAIDLLEPPLP